ncbi:polysaccharide biosynthesis tyrosine autokinase [Castellaniella sp. S9]|uniref:polysaccharide biosynthesis tyrosine autokinase n=1 Tax=Castellaniella sp. S9 TaxID=2993652 RepID=UPI0022B59043|nr:polysaccharide biosynthesis tyrosine autokinase [Castellaniella sp. S9]
MMEQSGQGNQAIQAGGLADEDEISLGELLNVLAQRVWLILGVFVVVLVAGVAYALLARPVYQADALIQVEDQKGSALSGLSQLSEFIGMQQSSVAGELEILRSREVLMKAIRATQGNVEVEVDSRFPLIGGWFARRHERESRGLAEPLWGLDGYAWGGERLVFAELDLPRRQWGEAFVLEATDAGYVLLDDDGQELAAGVVGERVQFQIAGEDASVAVKDLAGRPGTRFEVVEKSPIQAVEDLRKALSVSEAGKQSNIIRMSFKNHDVAFATEMVNAIARAYLAQNVERRSAEARSSLKFLEQQLPELKRNVDAAEDALSQYRSRSSTIAVDKEAEGLLQQAIKLENSRLELRLKRDELLQRFKPEHPEVKALGNQLAAVDKAIADLDKTINRLPKAQRELLPFERDARVNTALYISLLNNAQELRVAEAGTIGNVRIIDYAVRNDKPVEPRRMLVVAIAAALGAMLGLLMAFLAHFMRPAIQRSEQIEQATGLSTYVTVPESDGRGGVKRGGRPGRRRRALRGLLAVTHPEDPAVEALRSLRTGLTFAMMGAPGKVVAITGATSGVGKSFVASNFAVLLAGAGQRVALLDTDMRRPRLHESFGYDRKTPGLSSVLAGTAPLEDLLRTGPVEGLSVLPAGVVPPNPGELLLSPRFAELLDALGRTHDLIVLDTSPILPVADVLAVMRHASAAFIVARAEYSTVGEVRDALAKLRHSGVGDPVKGAIFNGVRGGRIGYGASYKYYYSYK